MDISNNTNNNYSSNSIFINDSNPANQTDRHGVTWDEPPFDPRIFQILETVLGIAITGIIAFWGVIANIINLIVFSRMGVMVDSNTVSLTGLAVSDLACCLLAFWGSVCLSVNMFFRSPAYDWDVARFLQHTSFLPRLIFIHITCCLTAYVALERFVAIVFPFKVKFLFTAKHSLLVVCAIFVVSFALYYPLYARDYPQWITTTHNKSILTFVPTGMTYTREMSLAFFYMCPIGLRILSFVTIVVCNATMLWKISSRKFRKSSPTPPPKTSTTPTAFTETTSATDDAIATITSDVPDAHIPAGKLKNASDIPGTTGNPKASKSNTKKKADRDSRLITSMSLVCTLFIVCFIPDLYNVITFHALPITDPSLRYHPFTIDTAYKVSGIFETVNSASNIFIYYTRSSRYRQRFIYPWISTGK